MFFAAVAFLSRKTVVSASINCKWVHPTQPNLTDDLWRLLNAAYFGYECVGYVSQPLYQSVLTLLIFGESLNLRSVNVVTASEKQETVK